MASWCPQELTVCVVGRNPSTTVMASMLIALLTDQRKNYLFCRIRVGLDLWEAHTIRKETDPGAPAVWWSLLPGALWLVSGGESSMQCRQGQLYRASMVHSQRTWSGLGSFHTSYLGP